MHARMTIVEALPEQADSFLTVLSRSPTVERYEVAVLEV